MACEITIREMRPEDAGAIKKLINGIMSGEFIEDVDAYNYDDLDNPVAHYGGERETFLVAENAGKIIGTVAIKEDGSDVALLRRMFVAPKWRGKGYGSRLLSKATEFCFKHNYKTVSFRGTARMRNALQLCLRNGFQKDDLSELGAFQLVALSRDL